MNRFTFTAPALIMALQLAGAPSPTPAQVVDPGDIQIVAPANAGAAIGGQNTNNQMDSAPRDVTDTPVGSSGNSSNGSSAIDRLSDSPPSPDSPDFGGLNTRGNRRQAATADTGPGAPVTGSSAATSADVRAIDDELIRIDLDLKDLEADIRTYQALMQSSRNQNESQSLQQTLFSYDAQRRALTAQARQLQATRRTAAARSGKADPGSPDPSIASRALAGENGRRLNKPTAGENPLSPETIVGNTVADVAGAVDVQRDQEMQKFIESIEDSELKERVYQLNSATRADKTMQKPMDELMTAIKAAGGKKAKLADVQGPLERAEAEATRKGVDSDKLLALFMAKAGVDAIPVAEHAKFVKVMTDFAAKNNDPAKPLTPVLAKKLEQAKADYVAYKNAEATYLQTNQGDPSKLGAAEKAFQAHLKSLKGFLKALDDATGQGRNPDGIHAKATPAPTLATRTNSTGDLPVPDAPTTSSPTTPATSAPAKATPAVVASTNTDALAKIAAALKAFDDGIDAKLTEIDNRMVIAWTKDRHWYAGWLGADPDPREKELSDLSKFYFAYDSTDKTGNTFTIWPMQFRQISAEAAAVGIDVLAEPSLKDAGAKARDGVLGTMLISRLLKGYDGHLKTIEDSDVAESEKQMFIDRNAKPPKFRLGEFRVTVKQDAITIRTGIEGLWTSQNLADARALLAQAIKGGTDVSSKLEDLKIQFHHFQERMSKGYVSNAGGYAHWMMVTDSPVYRLVEIVNKYLEAGMHFEAKLALDELR